MTHATDSTTRKKVGCFAPQGLHINADTYIPLPTLQLGSETTKNISDSIVTGFDVLAAASDHDAETLYSCVDLHMTDATAHNKGVAAEVADTLKREDPAGQLFCNPHTALGFDRCKKKVINSVEQKMDMTNLLNCFLLDVNINQQSDTIPLTVIHWILNLLRARPSAATMELPWRFRHHTEENGQTNSLVSHEGQSFRPTFSVMCDMFIPLGRFQAVSGQPQLHNEQACLFGSRWDAV